MKIRRQKPGPTGQYPAGKLTPDDKGELRIAIGSDPDTHKVVIDFGTSVTWLGMTPDDADGLAQKLIVHARRARGPARDDDETSAA